MSPRPPEPGTSRRSEPAAQLGCGRTIESVWERVDQPLDAHEQDCPDCRAARASLARLQTATDRMRRSSPELPSRGVKDAVMSVARAEVRRGRKLPVRTTESGTIQISEQIVAGLVRDVADEFPGVHARRCTVALDGPPLEGSDPQTLPEVGVREVDVTLGVAVALGAPIPAVLAQLRERVRERVEGRLGVVTARIDVTVEDVFSVTAGPDETVRELGAAS